MERQPIVLKEVCPRGTKSLPCAVYRTHSVGKGIFVKHHWHDEVEILYFSGGGFRLEINMESFPIQSECFCFINPGELHGIISETFDSRWEDAIVFSPGILGLDSHDDVQIRLMKPIQNGKLLFPRCIMQRHPAFLPLRDTFVNIMRVFGRAEESVPDKGNHESGCAFVNSDGEEDGLTRQLYIKASLLYMFAMLSDHGLFMPVERNFDKRVESIKTALLFIEENYHNKIYISDLAGQVNLNEQYFCRLFKRAIGHTPIEYINEYRIKQAKHLLEETDLQVTEVCLECGFNNLGNFLKEFRKRTGTTPLQYKKNMEMSWYDPG